MRSTAVCPLKSRRDLSLPMRLDRPPTRMNPATSNIATTCYYFRGTWAIVTNGFGFAAPSESFESHLGKHGIIKTQVDAAHCYRHRAFGFFNRSVRPGRGHKNRGQIE